MSVIACQGEEPGMGGAALADDQSHSGRHAAHQGLLSGVHPLVPHHVSPEVSEARALSPKN